MAKATVVDKAQLGYEFDGDMLVITDGDDVVRRFDFSDVPEELDGEFMALGRKTKLINFASGAKKLNRPRLEMIDEGWTQLCEGTWERERVGGAPTVSAEVEAMALLTESTVGEVQKALQGWTKEQRAKMYANTDVQREATKIRAARKSAEGKVDLSNFAK